MGLCCQTQRLEHNGALKKQIMSDSVSLPKTFFKQIKGVGDWKLVQLLDIPDYTLLL